MKPEPVEKQQRAWWEEGCYCPPGQCICGTEVDPFRTPRGEGDE